MASWRVVQPARRGEHDLAAHPTTLAPINVTPLEYAKEEYELMGWLSGWLSGYLRRLFPLNTV